MTYLATLQKQRTEVLDNVRNIATKAEAEGRAFTDTERATVQDGLAKADDLNEQIKRVNALHGTAAEVGELLGKAAAPMMVDRPNATALGGLFAKGLGLPVNTQTGRGHFDAEGHDRKALPGGITDAPRGRITVPTLRRTDGGSIFWAPAEGATFLDLMPLNPLGPEKTTYKVRRQIVGDRVRNARTVKVGGTKPTGLIPWETVENRARQFAVLSEPLNVADFRDVPFYGQDAANLLATDLIWAIEECVVSGDAENTADDRDDFDGLLTITGTLQQSYLTSPWLSIRRAITRLTDSGIPLGALTIHMGGEAWEEIETATTDDGKPLFDNLVSGASRSKVLYGVPVRTTSHTPETQALVGAWNTTQLNVRDGIEVDWSDSGTDDEGVPLFDKNQLRLRSETRVTVDFTVPSAFAVVDLEA